MTKVSSKGVVCLSVVAAFFMAAPLDRPPLDRPVSTHLIRAEERDGGDVQPELDLKSEEGTVCSGAPDFAKGSTIDVSPIPAFPSDDSTVFGKNRRQAVLNLIHYPWQDLGYSVVFKGSRLGYRAMTLTAHRRIEIYVRPGEVLMNQAFDLAHELGHAFDLKNNDDERRRKWCELRGIKPSAPWFGCDACPDYGTPAGDFAETFAYLLLGPGNFHSMMAPAPGLDQVEKLAEFCRIDHLSDVLLARMPKKPGAAAVKSAKTGKPPADEKTIEEVVQPREEIQQQETENPLVIENFMVIKPADTPYVIANDPLANQAPAQ